MSSPNRSTRRQWLGSTAAIAALLADAGARPLEAASAAAPVMEPPPDVYTRIGAKPFINCTATLTINGGSRLLPEVIEAIEHASHYHVDIDDLMDAAGKRISTLLKVPAAMVTSGAAGALAHAASGIVAGMDPERMQQLPDLTGLKTEVIIPKSSRNAYDHAVRMCGLKTVEVDSVEELKAAISHETAFVMVLGNRFDKVKLGLEEVAPIAKAAGLPVVVDAAADYLIVPNPYIAAGADLVACSGGKITRGPQTAGMLLGREDLIRAAWANSAPHHAFGRPMKVSKEEIVGMVAAVEVWVNSRDIKAEYKEWEGWYQYINDKVTKVAGVKTEVKGPSRGGPFPTLSVSWDPSKTGLTAGEVHDLLLDGNPAIMTHAAGDGSSFTIRPVAMKPDEYKIVAERLAEILSSAPAPKPKKALPAPKGDVTGRWDVSVEFQKGSAQHLVFLDADGANLVGTHFGSVKNGPIKGKAWGDEVEFSSSLKIEGTTLHYTFKGKVDGDRMAGSLDLGEYPGARFTAKRHGYGKMAANLAPVNKDNA
ncbi:MAG: aminotransferase class V-fold PLP-dependent enzyme [Acidobacteria bacterium]|nr:aminotransferase class V-fold PLP-dependent enzyme [Acidobacteriota bacterium]